jgi:HPt (histidine-containing phosphotransfer) domain-containing protein
MKANAHSLKGACGYVGASRLHYSCYYIQEAYLLNQFDKMLEKYPRLVESAIEFKRYSRKILAENRGELITVLNHNFRHSILRAARCESD